MSVVSGQDHAPAPGARARTALLPRRARIPVTWAVLILLAGFPLAESAESAADWIAQGRSAGTPAEAREAFARALELEPDNIAALLGRAQATSDNPARLKQADEDYTRVIAVDPAQWSAYLHRGALRHRVGRDARWNSQINTSERWLRLALDDLTRFLASPAANGAEAAFAFEMRARSYTILDQYAEALRDYESAAAADPAQTPAFDLERARLLTIQGKTTAGQALYAAVAEALLGAPSDAAPAAEAGRIAQRGEALWQLGRKGEACADYRWLCAEAAARDPAHLHCRKARERCP